MSIKPDLIVLGHADLISKDQIAELRQDYPNTKFCQWFLDPLNIDGPDYEKNKNRFFLKYQFCDANFVTTSVNSLNFADKKKTYFIPNPIDPSIDIYKNFNKKKPLDIFIAISHGQHRGILKTDFIDKGLVKFEHHAFPLDLAALNAEIVVRCHNDNKKKFELLGKYYKEQKKWAVGSDINKINELLKIMEL